MIEKVIRKNQPELLAKPWQRLSSRARMMIEKKATNWRMTTPSR
jgi:hypothetical protein